MQLARLLRGFIVALSLAARLAAAADGCPDETDREFALASLAVYEQKLQGLAGRCGQDARFLAWHGAVLKGLQAYPQAAELLELALMRDPELRGARIDYADVLVALGDADAGLDLVTTLLDDPHLPPGLRPHLEARRLGWQQDNWRYGGQVVVRAGYDNNLNNATRVREIGLSLPGGDVSLLLTPGSRARAGNFGTLEATAEAERRLSARDTLLVFGDLRARLSEQSETDYLQGEIDAFWRRREIDAETQWLLGFNNLAYDGASLFRQWRLGYTREERDVEAQVAGSPDETVGLGWRRHFGACRPNLGGDLEIRRYPLVSALDNTFFALRIGQTCRSEDLWRAFVRVGRELAENQRPGGDAWRFDARVVWRRPLLGGWLENDLSLSLQRDDQTYSPLLDRGAPRHVERLAWRVEYQWPLAPKWIGLLTLDLNKQYSNIDLFALEGQALSLGARYAF